MPETCEGKDMTELDVGRYTESDDDAGGSRRSCSDVPLMREMP